MIFVGQASSHHFLSKDCPLKTIRYADGEFSFLSDRSVQEQKIILIQSLCPPLHDHMMELLGAAHFLKGNFLTAVIPYLGYARQDKAILSGLELLAKLFKDVGIKKIVCVDVHSKRVLDFFDFPVIDISVHSLMASCLRDDPPNYLIAPDQGGVFRTQRIAEVLGVPFLVCDKRNFPKNYDFSQSSCVIIDDIVDSGRTLETVSLWLRSHGATSVRACVTHGILSEKRFLKSLDRLYITDTIKPKNHPKIEILKVAPLLDPYITLHMSI